MAKLIKVTSNENVVDDLINGITEIQPKDTENGFSLDECYELMDCDMVQVVNLKDDLMLICDEEACVRTDKQPVLNYYASQVASLYYGYNFPIMNTCILCNTSEFK